VVRGPKARKADDKIEEKKLVETKDKVEVKKVMNKESK
jgi:hypothetical protein